MLLGIFINIYHYFYLMWVTHVRKRAVCNRTAQLKAENRHYQMYINTAYNSAEVILRMFCSSVMFFFYVNCCQYAAVLSEQFYYIMNKWRGYYFWLTMLRSGMDFSTCSASPHTFKGCSLLSYNVVQMSDHMFSSFYACTSATHFRQWLRAGTDITK